MEVESRNHESVVLNAGITQKTPKQRMIMYQFVLSAGAWCAIRGFQLAYWFIFLDDDLISQMAAVGWVYAPYKP